jgi:hypothetical protein
VDFGRVEQNNLAVARVLAREPSEAGPDLDQAPADRRQ